MPKEFSFEADDKTIKDVLFAQRKFRVPRFQRPYAWEEEQTTELWNDLISNNEPYFLGSLVFCTEREKEEGYIEIIDGQQRLLTITIFIAVLRDIINEFDKTKAALFHRQDIAKEDRSGSETFRIFPDESIKTYFEKHIQSRDADILKSSPTIVEEKRVYYNYKYLYESVMKDISRFENAEDKIIRIEELRNKISELIVVVIEISREEDAYEIFETTNARGLDLSVSDLLKNLIFSKMPVIQTRDGAKETWKNISNNIQETDVELRKFIRYYWLSKYNFVTEKRLYREIRNKIVDWKNFLDELYDASELFNTLLDPQGDSFDHLKNNDKIHDSIFALSLMGVSQCYVLLLAILRNSNKIGTDPTRIIKTIENFTFIYSVVCKLPTNKVERMYSKYAIQIENAALNESSKKIPGIIQSIFSKIEAEIKNELPPYDYFKKSFYNLTYKNSDKSRRLIKYTLERIDRFYGTREYKINFNMVNIEHLLPSTPEDRWKLTKEDIAPYVNRMGNLTLLSKKINGRLQNKIIDEKLPELKESELLITKDVVKQIESNGIKWNKDEIIKRQDKLTEIAYKNIWCI